VLCGSPTIVTDDGHEMWSLSSAVVHEVADIGIAGENVSDVGVIGIEGQLGVEGLSGLGGTLSRLAERCVLGP
jgi:hypothetical protein